MSAISHAEMVRLGWIRVDGRKGKLDARWKHGSGWSLQHCGHPTANYPWMLRDRQGRLVLSGVASGQDPTHGRCWPDLRSAVEWFASWEALPWTERVADRRRWARSCREALESGVTGGIRSRCLEWAGKAVQP